MNYLINKAKARDIRKEVDTRSTANDFSNFQALGSLLLKGKKITEITLRGKTYVFEHTPEVFREVAQKSGWDEEHILYALEFQKEHPSVQGDFICDFTSDFCLDSGGFGSGKSTALYIKLILACMCFPGNRVLLGRKTLSDIDRAVLPELFDLMHPKWYEHRVKDGLINFNNGSQIILFGLDAMQSGNITDIKKAQQKLKSLNLGGYFIDQLEEVEHEVFEVLNSRLRRTDVPFRQGNMDCNPANFWAYHYFKKKEVMNEEGNWYPNKNGEKVALYESSMLTNPYLPGDYIRKQLAMDETYVKRFVRGEWTTDVLLKGTVFAKEHIQNLERMRKPPLEKKEGCEIYEHPMPGEIYQMGVDPSEGIVDPSSISVVSASGKKVAKFNGMATIPELADKIKFLYYTYHKPLIIPEVNRSSILEHIKDLRVYKRKQFDYKNKKETDKLGFVTSWASKQALITNFQELLRAGVPKIYDPKTVEEMKSFMYANDATLMGAAAARGFHDDDLISTMLAFWELSPKKMEQVKINKQKPILKKRFQYA